MRKKAGILISIAIVIILILIPVLIQVSLNFTGFAVKEPEKQVEFHFYDELTNCPLNGYIFVNEKPIGKSEDGYFDLTYANYIENVKNKEEISIFGKLGDCFENPDLYFDKYYTLPEIKEYNFLGISTFDFKTNINSNNPTKKELQGFVQPERIRIELNKINRNQDKFKVLSEINKYLNNKIEYIVDWEFEKSTNYWQTPPETLDIQTGDCEDFSTTLLSLFLAHDSSLNCYNLVFTSHVTTFCHIEDYYIYYDQKRTELKKEITKLSNPLETQSKLSKLKQDYFDYYGINGNNETKIHYAYNDNEYVEFKDETHFINWQYNLANIKTKINLFPDIEQQVIQNQKNLQEINLEEGELKTQTISLPASKNFSFLIYGIISIILILIIMIFLIKKLRAG